MSNLEQRMEEWLNHRRILEKLLEPIEDEHVNFKPWEGGRTIGELTLHVSFWGYVFVSIVKSGGEMSEYIGKEPDASEYKTMSDIREAVHEFTEKTKDVYVSLTEAELEARTDTSHPRLQGPRKIYLTLMYDHELHHKGQLYVYARMVGVKEVPFFR